MIRTALQSLMKFRRTFYRNMRRLNLPENEPQLARKTIAYPAENRYYSSNAGGRHPRGCPTGVGLTRRHVSVPWRAQSVTDSSRHNVQRDKRLSYNSRQRARSIVRLGAIILSTRR